MRRTLVLVAVTAAFLGILPGQAWGLRVVTPPIAPPITGMCTSPLGSYICMVPAAVTAGFEVAQWVDSFEGTPQGHIGITPHISGDNSWCLGNVNYLFTQEACSLDTSGMSVALDPEQLLQLQALLEAQGDLDPWGGAQTAGELTDPAEFQLWLPADPELFEVFGLTEVAIIQRPCGGSVVCSPQGTLSATHTPAGDGFRQDLVFVRDENTTYCETVKPEQLINGLANPASVGSWESCTAVTIARWQAWPGSHPGTSSQSPSSVTSSQRNPADNTCPDSAAQNYGFQMGGADAVYVHLACKDAGAIMTPVAKTCTAPERECAFVGIQEYDAMGDPIDTVSWIEMTRQEEYDAGFVVTTVQCQDGAGNITTRVSSSPSVEPIVGGTVDVPAGGCLPGELPVGATVSVCDSSGFTNCIPVSSWDAPVSVEPGTPEYSCMMLMATPTPCPLWLEYFDGTDWVECELEVTQCVGWWEAPNRETHYRCGWGGDYYSASQCVALKNFYETEEITTTTPNQPQPDPVPEGGPSVITGPATPPAQQPRRTWMGQIITEFATGSLTGNWFDSCWPQGWGLLNPGQWVLRPIVCAMVFVWVPSKVDIRLQEWHQQVSTTTKAGIITDAQELLGGLGGPSVGGGCGWGIPAVNAGVLTTPELQVILCPSDYGLSGTAGTVRGWMHVVVGVGAVSMVYRWMRLGRPEELGDEGIQGTLF